MRSLRSNDFLLSVRTMVFSEGEESHGKEPCANCSTQNKIILFSGVILGELRDHGRVLLDNISLLLTQKVFTWSKVITPFNASTVLFL